MTEINLSEFLQNIFTSLKDQPDTARKLVPLFKAVIKNDKNPNPTNPELKPGIEYLINLIQAAQLHAEHMEGQVHGLQVELRNVRLTEGNIVPSENEQSLIDMAQELSYTPGEETAPNATATIQVTGANGFPMTLEYGMNPKQAILWEAEMAQHFKPGEVQQPGGAGGSNEGLIEAQEAVEIFVKPRTDKMEEFVWKVKAGKWPYPITVYPEKVPAITEVLEFLGLDPAAPDVPDLKAHANVEGKGIMCHYEKGPSKKTKNEDGTPAMYPQRVVALTLPGA